MTKPLFYKKTGNAVTCTLCPNNCLIKEGKSGSCRIRFNRNGNMKIPFAGKISALAVDPVEKKPLYHFFPGKDILSTGFYGCSLKCPFCQNYSISSGTRIESDTVSPEDMAAAAAKSGTIGLAYTYSEPSVHIEWVYETSKLLHKKNLKNVLVTNGYINLPAAEYLLENTDAANIDLKSFNPDFYSKELGGRLEPVKEFIRLASAKIHIEVTTLVIPGKNDSTEEIREIAGFLSGIDRKIPYHLSCYFPAYKYTDPPTKSDTVLRLADAALQYLDYVYPGNMGPRDNSTLCPVCSSILVKRTGYKAEAGGLDKDGKCLGCGEKTSIVLK